MKNSVVQQYAIVKENTAPLFTAKLNNELERLKDNDPTVTFSATDPLCAYVSYIVTERHPETIEEASSLEGVRFVCEQCPMFRPILKADGTVDGRCKFGDCTYEGNEFGRALKRQPACSYLYELIQGGGVKVCFK